METPPSLGLALGGGAVLGAAHIGVLQARAADIVITPDTTSWSRSQMLDIPALVREGNRVAKARLGS